MRNLCSILTCLALLLGPSAVSAGAEKLEGFDIHDCAEGADEDIEQTPIPTPTS